MPKVYVVTRAISYEGEDVKGVFSTPGKALDFGSTIELRGEPEKPAESDWATGFE